MSYSPRQRSAPGPSDGWYAYRVGLVDGVPIQAELEALPRGIYLAFAAWWKSVDQAGESKLYREWNCVTRQWTPRQLRRGDNQGA